MVGERIDISASDGPIYKAAQTLLEAASEYWRTYQLCIGSSAVVYVKSDDGRVVIITRGEYTDALMEGVDDIRNEVTFEHPDRTTGGAT